MVRNDMLGICSSGFVRAERIHHFFHRSLFPLVRSNAYYAELSTPIFMNITSTSEATSLQFYLCHFHESLVPFIIGDVLLDMFVAALCV